MAGGRRRTAPVRLIIALAVFVLFVVVVPSLRAAENGSPSTADGERRAGAPDNAPVAGRAPVAGPALGYGPGPQQQYGVHPADPVASCHFRDEGGRPLPDPICTPGALNPAVTAASMGRTICRSGYSSSIRPPVRITDQEKRDSARAYGFTGSFRTAEYDHLVPLSLGGDPNDDRNLWLEPNDDERATSTTNGKDGVEDRLHAAVCDHRVDLTAAQRAIATDWASALATLGLQS